MIADSLAALSQVKEKQVLDKEKGNAWQLFFPILNLSEVSYHFSFPFCGMFPCILPRAVLSVSISARLTSFSLFFSSHKVAMLICAGFLIAWIPYAVVSVWSAFGQPDSVPIQFSVVPTLLAKSAAMYNPIIYQVIDCKFACCRSGGLKTLQKKSSLKKSR